MHFKINNLKVFLTEVPTATVQFRLKTDVGSCSENDSQSHGAAHFLEHMLFKGTKTRTRQDISLKLGTLGDGNAFTDRDETAYHITTIPSNAKQALELLFDMFFNSKLAKFDFEKERNVILEEHQMYQDDPNSFFFDNLAKMCLGYHPIVGTRKSIENMTPSIIRKFIKQHYHSGNVSLHVAGPMKKQVIQKIIDDVGFDLPDGEPYKFEKVLLDISPTSFNHAAKQSMYGIVYPGISNVTDFKKNFVGSLFRVCLGGGFGSVLEQKIRDDMGLCYHIGCHPWLEIADEGITLIYTAMDKKNIKKCADRVDKIIRDVRKNGFDPEVINFAKQNLKYRIARSSQEPGSVIEMFSKLEQETEIEGLTTKMLLKKLDKTNNNQLIEFANEFMIGEPKRVIMNP